MFICCSPIELSKHSIQLAGLRTLPGWLPDSECLLDVFSKCSVGGWLDPMTSQKTGRAGRRQGQDSKSGN